MVDINRCKKLYLSTIFNKVEYVQLDTTKEIFFSKSKKTRIAGKYMFIVETHQREYISAFDISNGERILTIEQFGRGPEDITFPKSLFINIEDNEFVVFDSGKRQLLTFNFNRNLVRKKYCPIFFQDFYINNNGNYIFYTGNVNRYYQSRWEIITDVHSIKADFLIDNIKQAFLAYEKIQTVIPYSYNLFQEYVLPYRVSTEHYAYNNRRKLMEKYDWVYDEYKANVPLPELINQLVDSMQLAMHPYDFPSIIPTANMEKIKYGSCDDMNNYILNALRAVGIPCALDKVTRYGDQHNGHSWIAIFTDQDTIYRNPGNGEELLTGMRQSSIAKIFRYTYKIQDKPTIEGYHYLDVTGEYRATVNTSVKIAFNKPEEKTKNLLLAIFTLPEVWKPMVISSSKKGNLYSFENLGKDIIYLPGYQQNDQFVPVNHPFYFDSLDRKIELKSSDKLSQAVIVRKYPPYMLRNHRFKLKRLHDMTGGRLLLAQNPDFSDAAIDSIPLLNSTQQQELSINDSYRFLKISYPYDEDKRFFAEFKVIDERDSVIDVQPQITGNGYDISDRYKKLVDNDPLSFVAGRGLTIEYDFKSPIKIKNVIYQAKNDDNHIRIGDRYELFYWDNSWHSLGQQQATDTMLMYPNIPGNSLYWLRNLTRGREEEVFILSETGEQIWPSLQFQEG